MMIDDLFVDEQVISCCHFPHAQCYRCNEFCHFAQDCPSKIPLSGTPCHQDRSLSGQWYTHLQRDRSQSTYYGHRHGRQINWSQSCHHPQCNRSCSSFKSTHCAPYPATAVASTALQLTDTPISIHAMTHLTGTVALHSTLTTSPADVIHATILQPKAGLTPAILTALHRKHSQWGKPSHAQDLQPPVNPTIPRLLSNMTPHQKWHTSVTKVRH